MSSLKKTLGKINFLVQKTIKLKNHTFNLQKRNVKEIHKNLSILLVSGAGVESFTRAISLTIL